MNKVFLTILILIFSVINASASVRFYHSDHLGSSSITTDESGTVVHASQYYPFGETFSEEDNGFTPIHKYTGQEKDEESKLYYYKARYYDQNIGKFLSTDPVGAISYIEDPQSQNLYSYVRNNPLKYVDPSGGSATENAFFALNVGIPMAAAVYKGIERGDSFGTVLKNTVIAGAASAGSFYLKDNLGKLQEGGMPFVAARATNDVLTSVMNNAIRGERPFDVVTFDIFSPVRGKFEDGKLNVALDFGKSIDTVMMLGMASLGITKLNLEKSLETGALFGGSMGRGFAFPFGGAIIAGPSSEIHEKIHHLEYQQFTKFSLALQDKAYVLDRPYLLNPEEEIGKTDMFLGGYENLKDWHAYTQVAYPAVMSQVGLNSSPYSGFTYEGEAEFFDDN